MPTIEERAREALNAVSRERDDYARWDASDRREDIIAIETTCRLIEEFDAERAAHAQFRQKVSDAVEDYYGEYRKDLMHPLLSRFILPKPVDPLVEAVREAMDADNETNVQFADDLRAALAKRGGRIVFKEVGDA